MLPSFTISLSDRILRVAYFLLPPMALLVPLGLAPLGLLAAVLLLATAPRPWTPPPRRLVVLLALTPLLAAVSAVWSLDPFLSLKGAGQVGAIAAAALMLGVAATSRDFRPAASAVLAGLAFSLLLLVLDRLLGNQLIGWVHRLNLSVEGWEIYAQSSTKRGTSVIAVLCWPLVGALMASGRRRSAVIALIMTGGCVLAGYSSTAILALAAGVPMFLLFHFAGRRAALPVIVLLMGVVGVMPWAVRQLPPPQELWDAHPWIPNSAHHRLTIWHFTADRVAEKPVLGWGMDAARVMPGSEDTIKVGRTVDGREWLMFEQMLPLHPHNAILHWWLELGMVGAFAMAGLCAALIAAAAAKLPSPSHCGGLAGLASGLVCASSAFGAWQSWWLLALAMIVPLALFPPRTRIDP